MRLRASDSNNCLLLRVGSATQYASPSVNNSVFWKAQPNKADAIFARGPLRNSTMHHHSSSKVKATNRINRTTRYHLLALSPVKESPQSRLTCAGAESKQRAHAQKLMHAAIQSIAPRSLSRGVSTENFATGTFPSNTTPALSR